MIYGLSTELLLFLRALIQLYLFVIKQHKVELMQFHFFREKVLLFGLIVVHLRILLYGIYLIVVQDRVGNNPRL